MENRISPDNLLDLMGSTPADNPGNHTTACHWMSQLVAQQVKSLVQFKQFFQSITENTPAYSPFASAKFAAQWQKAILDIFVLEPIRTQARIAANTGITPDIFIDHNRQTEEKYAELLYKFCTLFMTDKKFDFQKAREYSSSDKGKEILKKYIQEFSWIEKNYLSSGLTRLTGMKELLVSLLILITEQPLKHRKMPFMKYNKDGRPDIDFSEYLAVTKIRIENLFNEKAFDIINFSRRETGGNIGYSSYEIVPGTEMNSIRLRHYLLPDQVKPNEKILYMATPLINKPEIFDLDDGKSVIQGMHKQGYEIYLVDYGDPGPESSELGLDYFAKTVHDKYLEIIKQKHPGLEIYIMAYCMGGTLILPYLARRAEERMAEGKEMDIKKLALMASPVKFDDKDSGHGPMRKVIREQYDNLLMQELFNEVNIPPQVIDFGMQEIQPGVQYYVYSGFYGRASFPGAIKDSAPFIYWLAHGTKFPFKAHREWINNIFLGNQIFKGKYCLSSNNPKLDKKPVNMDMLRRAGVAIFDYRGQRDPIAPAGSCTASELWGQTDKCSTEGQTGNLCITRGGLNRTIEKNVGHIFVVSKILLAEYLEIVNEFYQDKSLKTSRV
ncbi:alpha/beta hydrolase fold-containing [Desulfonema limicola]|uniref:Alpha/beta hydrolase fold-containing n=1 Tax=Desulfonema limicola TaxID=45656 RepID=A0A975GFY9_9BACT|nr:hypothetical protein [Desulfonema limicola]QTA79767.1 alpha/beta hydrolase fold-containing [Desulfonema limicola]